jgi:methionine-rich copper-binding protein CopC
MKRGFLFAASLCLALAVPRIATAHALLVKAVPAVGGAVSASPADIKITFSEAVEPRFSKIVVTGADGRSVETGAANVEPADHATLVAALKTTLQPGSYKVNWHAVSVDTHATQGSFTFTVKP